MYKRLNITLPEETLAQADAFARRERYTRSALIAAALDAFVSGEAPSTEIAREASTVYAPEAVGPNPAVRPKIPAIIEACRRHGVVRAALVGSSTQPDPSVTPADVDILVTLDRTPEGYADRYFGLLTELERIMGMPVDIIEAGAVRNPYLREEFERTKVVLYEAA
jgi:predicted nucleotidyltransferase